MVRKLFILLATLVMLTACAAPAPTVPKVHVENAWARPTTASAMNVGSATPEMQGMSGMSASETSSAVYFVLVNDGDAADALIGASADVAKVVDLHETQINNDVAQMIPVSRVEVPAHGKIEFKPGGYHVMLDGLTRDLKVGDTLKLTLQFEKSGAIALDVPVQQEK